MCSSDGYASIIGQKSKNLFKVKTFALYVVISPNMNFSQSRHLSAINLSQTRFHSFYFSKTNNQFNCQI